MGKISSPNKSRFRLILQKAFESAFPPFSRFQGHMTQSLKTGPGRFAIGRRGKPEGEARVAALAWNRRCGARGQGVAQSPWAKPDHPRSPVLRKARRCPGYGAAAFFLATRGAHLLFRGLLSILCPFLRTPLFPLNLIFFLWTSSSLSQEA